MSAPTVLIMAAGEGKRMNSSLPKVLHRVCGRPMIGWPIEAARAAGAGRVAVIVSPERDISSALDPEVETVVQKVADGTGGALRAALGVIESSRLVIVLSGDVPLVSAEIISELIAVQAETGAAAVVTTTDLEEPDAYGRIIRGPDDDLERIVEAGDATAAELEIGEINAGTYVFDGAALVDALGRIDNDNAQGEYYLGDVLPLMREAGRRVVAHKVADRAVNIGVNTRADLALVEAEARARIIEGHLLAGVSIADPGSTWIDAEVEIEPEARIWPGCVLRGETTIGAGVEVGPHTTLIDSTIGAGSRVPHSYLVECEVDDGCSVGPFAYLRPGAHLHEGAKAGTFVEVKNSEIGPGAKVPHLSYVGDADIGEGSNLGAGTITANYDGYSKHRTKIGARTRIGVDTALVAPVEVGDDAYTGAGSVIASDVPEGALGIVRAKQVNVDGYAERKQREADEGRSDK